MKPCRDELLQLALQLPPEERLDLADLLWASVHSQEEVMAAWSAEVERRADALDTGQIDTVSVDEAVEQLRSKICGVKK